MTDDVLVTAMAQYLEESLEQEKVLRDLLTKVGYNDPERTVEECFENLILDHLRLISAA
jgi:SHS2 domain-containing protein